MHMHMCMCMCTPAALKADEEAVFSNVEMLVAVNRQLLEALRTPTASDPVASVSAAFSTMAPFFKAYSVYCANFVSALDHLDRLRQERPQLDEFVRRAEAAGGETIGSMLIRPVQRLCKYPLLFRELRGAVAADHPARDALLRAEADVANTASEVKRAHRTLHPTPRPSCTLTPRPAPPPCTLTLHSHSAPSPTLSPCTVTMWTLVAPAPAPVSAPSAPPGGQVNERVRDEERRAGMVVLARAVGEPTLVVPGRCDVPAPPLQLRTRSPRPAPLHLVSTS